MRILANIFLKNYKTFLLCPVLCHSDPEVNKYLLDMVEGIGNIGTIVEVAAPIAKKDAKFVYFSVFSMKNQSSRLFMKKTKWGKGVVRSSDKKKIDKSEDQTILTDGDDPVAAVLETHNVNIPLLVVSRKNNIGFTT